VLKTTESKRGQLYDTDYLIRGTWSIKKIPSKSWSVIFKDGLSDTKVEIKNKLSNKITIFFKKK
jgi:phosphopantetheinyl transferase (holo-ACP synthase)